MRSLSWFCAADGLFSFHGEPVASWTPPAAAVLATIKGFTTDGRYDPSLFVRRRKPKDEERLFICERRLRNPHAPRFSAPKIFRGSVAQYLPSRAYRLVTSSFEVREFHSYAVDFGAIIFNMEIV
jgi:hypothetical protein